MTVKVANILQPENNVEQKSEEALELRDRIKQLENENARLKTQVTSSKALDLEGTIPKKPEPKKISVAKEMPRERSASLSIPTSTGNLSLRSPLEAVASRPQSSMARSQDCRPTFRRSSSYKSPPMDLGTSPHSFKANWGGLGEGNRSFKEPLSQGAAKSSYGQTSENEGIHSADCCKSFKAPQNNCGASQRSFKTPLDRGEACKSFKDYTGNSGSQESDEETFNDVLFPMRATGGQ